MPDSYSPTYVEAAWYAWWEKEVRSSMQEVHVITFVCKKIGCTSFHKLRVNHKSLLDHYCNSNCIIPGICSKAIRVYIHNKLTHNIIKPLKEILTHVKLICVEASQEKETHNKLL